MTTRKLSHHELAELRRRCLAGDTDANIARDLEVNRSTVMRHRRAVLAAASRMEARGDAANVDTEDGELRRLQALRTRLEAVAADPSTRPSDLARVSHELRLVMRAARVREAELSGPIGGATELAAVADAVRARLMVLRDRAAVVAAVAEPTSATTPTTTTQEAARG